MNKELEDKKRKLKKDKRNIYLLMMVGWILSFYISAHAIVTVLPLAEFIFILFDVNNITRDLVLSVMELFYRFLPTMVYVGGQVKLGMISKEISQLDEGNYKKYESVAKIVDEEEVLKVYDIVDRFESLPRDKQMEVLNYIKGDLSKEDEQLCIQISELSDTYKGILQTECEDIVFPDFTDEGYTRKRTK